MDIQPVPRGLPPLRRCVVLWDILPRIIFLENRDDRA